LVARCLLWAVEGSCGGCRASAAEAFDVLVELAGFNPNFAANPNRREAAVFGQSPDMSVGGGEQPCNLAAGEEQRTDGSFVGHVHVS
jgi:hypothetical protein